MQTSHPYDCKSDATTESGMPPIPLPPPPREARFKTSVKVIATAIIVFAMLGDGVAAYFGFSYLDKLEHLRDNGVLVPGRVINKTISSSRKSTTHYFEYTFQAGNVEVRDKDSVSKSDYNRFEVGDALPVTYERGKPEVNQPFAVDGATVDRHKKMMWIVGGILAAIELTMLTIFGYIWLRRLKLARDGELVSAKIAEVGNPQGKNHHRKVKFDVRTPTGEVVQRSHWMPEHVFTTSHLGRTTGYLVLDQDPKKGEPAVTVFKYCVMD